MKIQNLEFESNLFLAPLAGYTDLPFRIICERYGCQLTYTEMVNAKALCYDDKNTFKMLDAAGQKEKVAVQIFGSEPHFMGEAAKILTQMGRFDIIDINMGCPVPKVVKNGEGSALMKEPAKASRIVKEVKKSTHLPVTVKIRKGWDGSHINAVEFAVLMEKSGADAVTVHGRTREEYFSGKADWDIIKKVKDSLKVPVIGNGDVISFKDKEDMIVKTGCDAVMIGRGAVGNPFIFLDAKGESPQVTTYEKISTMINHYKIAIDILGERLACLHMRKHINAYLKGIPDSNKIKNTINTITDTEKVVQILTGFGETLTNERNNTII